jgi:ABC-2 type transport system permease protein
MSALAASPLFLLRHEMRLQWRTLSKKTPLLITLAVLILFLHAIAAGLAYSVRFMPPVPANALLVGITCALTFLLLMSISSGIVVAVQNIYARGDMDLLLSSPLAPRTLFLVRGLAIAATLCGGACALLLPFANMLALFVTAKWLFAYAALMCVALLGTGISLILAHGLFRLLGPRRARLFAQILGGLLAAVLPLLGQIPNAISASTKQHAANGLMAMIDHGPAADSWMWLPARAFTGDPLALAVIASICGAVFAVATLGLAEALVGGTIAAAGTATGRASARTTRTRGFRATTRSVLRRKELRLILRDPWVITQIGQQMIFLAPLGLLLWQHGFGGVPSAWLLLVAVAGMLGSGLAWLAVSGEDAPDLLAAAPVGWGEVLRAKLEAVLLMVGTALVAPLAVAWRADAWLGFTLTLCCLGSAVSGALLEVLYPSPGKRSEFNKRAQGRVGVGLTQLALVCGWALTGFLMLHASLWAPLPLLVLGSVAVGGKMLR